MNRFCLNTLLPENDRFCPPFFPVLSQHDKGGSFVRHLRVFLQLMPHCESFSIITGFYLPQMSKDAFKSVQVIVLVSVQFSLFEGFSGTMATLQGKKTLILSSKLFTYRAFQDLKSQSLNPSIPTWRAKFTNWLAGVVIDRLDNNYIYYKSVVFSDAVKDFFTSVMFVTNHVSYRLLSPSTKLQLQMCKFENLSQNNEIQSNKTNFIQSLEQWR